MILAPLLKLPKNVEDLGKFIVAKSFKSYPKCKKSPTLVTLQLIRLSMLVANRAYFYVSNVGQPYGSTTPSIRKRGCMILSVKSMIYFGIASQYRYSMIQLVSLIYDLFWHRQLVSLLYSEDESRCQSQKTSDWSHNSSLKL